MWCYDITKSFNGAFTSILLKKINQLYLCIFWINHLIQSLNTEQKALTFSSYMLHYGF